MNAVTQIPAGWIAFLLLGTLNLGVIWVRVSARRRRDAAAEVTAAEQAELSTRFGYHSREGRSTDTMVLSACEPSLYVTLNDLLNERADTSVDAHHRVEGAR